MKGNIKNPINIVSLMALLISAVSLFISVYSFYLSNFRVNDEASARIVSVDFNGDISQGEYFVQTYGKPRYLIANVAFMNAGNRNAIIVGASFLLSGDLLSKGDLAGFDGESSEVGFPFLIPPHETRLVRFRMRTQAIETFLDTKKKILGKLNYKSIDSRGNLYSVNAGYQFSVTFNKKEGYSIRRYDGLSDYSLTPLFVQQTDNSFL